MRNFPFAFLDEETIDQINRAGLERAAKVDAFAHLAETQKSMRGVVSWTANADIMKAVVKRFVAALEKMMEMSGPNSIANLERALRSRNHNSR